MSILTKFLDQVSVMKSSWDTIFLKNREYTVESENVWKYPYEKSDLVYICISTTGRAISQVPLVIHRKDGARWIPVKENNPYQQLIINANPYLDQYSLIECIIGYLLLDGNCFIIPFPPKANPPIALYVIRRKNMEPIKDKKGHLIGWKYTWKEEGGQDWIPLALNEVTPIFLWNPDDPYYGMVDGMPPIKAGKIAVVSDFKAARYNEIFFDEGAVPGGFISTDKILGDKAFKRIKAQFEDQHKGYKKGHRLAILDHGLKYSQGGIAQKDMEFLDLRKYNRQTILQVFGMKEAIISITSDVNYATAREQRKEWWEDTNLPLMRLVSSAIDSYLLRGTGLSAKWDIRLIAALHDKLSEKVETGLNLFKMGFTANEINGLLEFGFDDKPWRNFSYLPVNMSKVNDDGSLNMPKAGMPQLPSRQIDAYDEPLMLESPKEIDKRDVQKIIFNMRKKTLELLYSDNIDVKGLYSKEKEELSKFGKDFSTLADVITDQVIKQIEKGIVIGESVDEIAERVRSVYRMAQGMLKYV